jgi:hypothetical protein
MQNDRSKKQQAEKDPRMPHPTRQQQSDPQITELRGFIDENEKLEPMDEEIKKAHKKNKEENLP